LALYNFLISESFVKPLRKKYDLFPVRTVRSEGCIFRKWDGRAWTGLIWLRIGTGEGSFKRGNELSGSIKCGEFLD
jgi:hypothetical protein